MSGHGRWFVIRGKDWKKNSSKAKDKFGGSLTHATATISGEDAAFHAIDSNMAIPDIHLSPTVDLRRRLQVPSDMGRQLSRLNQLGRSPRIIIPESHLSSADLDSEEEEDNENGEEEASGDVVGDIIGPQDDEMPSWTLASRKRYQNVELVNPSLEFGIPNRQTSIKSLPASKLGQSSTPATPSEPTDTLLPVAQPFPTNKSIGTSDPSIFNFGWVVNRESSTNDTNPGSSSHHGLSDSIDNGNSFQTGENSSGKLSRTIPYILDDIRNALGGTWSSSSSVSTPQAHRVRSAPVSAGPSSAAGEFPIGGLNARRWMVLAEDLDGVQRFMRPVLSSDGSGDGNGQWEVLDTASGHWTRIESSNPVLPPVSTQAPIPAGISESVLDFSNALSQSRRESSSPTPLAQSPPKDPTGSCHVSQVGDSRNIIDEVQISVPPLRVPAVRSFPTSQTATPRELKCPRPGSWVKSEDYLGKGSFGSVFKCLNTDTGEFFVAKQVPRMESLHVEQLLQEIETLKLLKRHPNIVQYLGTEMDDVNVYIFLEFMENGSLQKILREFKKPFKEEIMRLYTRQLLEGLAYLHDKELIHRDIKGANILLDKNGTVKLADFGLSKFCDTTMTMGQGTVWWMAPELLRGSAEESEEEDEGEGAAGENDGYEEAERASEESAPSFRYGPEVDIWSVGCTVLEMATGMPPWFDWNTKKPKWRRATGPLTSYCGELQIQAMIHIAQTKDPPPIPPHLSDQAKSFILRCCQLDPSRRPSARELLEDPFILEAPSGLQSPLNFPTHLESVAMSASTSLNQPQPQPQPQQQIPRLPHRQLSEAVSDLETPFNGTHAAQILPPSPVPAPLQPQQLTEALQRLQESQRDGLAHRPVKIGSINRRNSEDPGLVSFRAHVVEGLIHSSSVNGSKKEPARGSMSGGLNSVSALEPISGSSTGRHKRTVSLSVSSHQHSHSNGSRSNSRVRRERRGGLSPEQILQLQDSLSRIALKQVSHDREMGSAGGRELSSAAEEVILGVNVETSARMAFL